MTTALAISLAVLAWPWVGYPVWLAVCALVRPRPVGPVPRLPARAVSVVIAARDEARALGPKLASLREAGVPLDRLEIIVVDDGSTDETAGVALAAGARVQSLGAPAGKAAALNVGIATARHPLVVFTDARQPLEPGALAALLAPFDDPRVGAVGGEIVGAARGPGGLYRRFDDALRRLEARSGSAVGVAGALWAARRALLPRLPEGLILDDLLAPLAVAAAGRRVVVAPTARVIEQPWASDTEAERRRRRRTLAGNLQLVVRAPWLLVPGRNPLWFRLFSHKLVRLAGPAALAVAVVASIAAVLPGASGAAGSHGSIEPVLAAGVGLALALAALGRVAGRPGTLARAFIIAQGQCAGAWLDVLSGRTRRLWRPAASEVSHGVP